MTVPEEECEKISKMPVKETMAFIVSLSKDGIPLKDFLERVKDRYPEVRSGESGVFDFDWVLSFPGDDDVYCLSEELGRTTCHRFSEEDYLAMGFRLPRRYRHLIRSYRPRGSSWRLRCYRIPSTASCRSPSPRRSRRSRIPFPWRICGSRKATRNTAS